MKLSTLMQMPSQRVREDEVMHRIFESFKLTQAVVSYIQQLIQLMADVQRHRACSLAILSGNAHFENQVVALQRKVNARLAYLDAVPELTEIIDVREWENVLAEWKVVGFGWRKDNVLHNFELHSHLIEKILNIVRDSGRWVLKSSNYSETVANRYLAHAVFEFIFAAHLYQIETLGRLRGLATHVASSGCEEAMRVRLTYLIQCTRQEHEACRTFFAEQPAAVVRNIPALLDVQKNEAAFTAWIDTMQNILDGCVVPCESTSTQAFTLATTVIDAKLAANEQILAYLQLAIEEVLELVLDESASS